MSKPPPRSDKFRFPLPDNHDPTEDWCIVVRIPGQAQYLAMLVSHLKALTFSENFDRDETKSGAAEVSRRWESALFGQPIIRMGCNPLMDVRQNEDNPCTLEKTFDDGLTWETFANMQLCPPLVIRSPDGNIWWWNPLGGGTGGDPGSGAWEPVPTPSGMPDTTAPPSLPPYPPGSSEYEDETARCIAAANLADVLKSGVGSLVHTAVEAEAWSFVVICAGLVVLTMLGLFPAVPILAMALLALASGIEIDTLETDYGAYDFTNIRDAIYCHLERDGSMTEAGRAALLEDLSSLQIGTSTNQIEWMIYIILQNCNAAGLTADAKIPHSTIDADCSGAECHWTHVFDFTNGTEGLSFTEICGHGIGQLTGNGMQTEFTYVDPCPTYNSLMIANIIRDCTITYAKVEGHNESAPTLAVGVFPDMSGGRGHSTFLYVTSISLGDFVLEASGTDATNGFELYLGTGTNTGSEQVAWISKLTLEGPGDDPFL